MKFNEFTTEAEKTRLDPKCWTGKKIGNPKTKVKGGVRVNNCVPAESVEEAANTAQQAAIAIAKKKKQDSLNEFLDTQAIAQDPDLEKDPDVDVIIFGRMPEDFTHNDVVEALEAILPREYPPGSSQNRAGVPDSKAEIVMGKIRDVGGAVITNKPLSIARKLVKTFQTYGIKCRIINNESVAEEVQAKTDDKLLAYYAQRKAEKEKQQGTSKGGQVYGQPEWKKPRVPSPTFTPGKPLPQSLQQKLGNKKQHQGVEEGSQRVDSLVTDALKIMQGSEASDAVAALKTVLGDREYNSRRGYYNFYVRQLMDMSGQQGVAEDYNPEYDDEAGMVENNLETLDRAVEGLDDLINSGDNLPEWCQEKIAVAKSMLVAVWDYMYSEEASDEVDQEVDEMFEAMEDLVSEMAQKNRVSEDLVWESFEALPDNVLYETAAWRRKEGKSKKGGLNAKGVASYRRENPGSKLQMAVTTKPSKLKPGSKAAKRRKSFCARMSGVKGPMKKPNGKPTRKALALRKWNC
jgi:hypothetical protein